MDQDHVKCVRKDYVEMNHDMCGIPIRRWVIEEGREGLRKGLVDFLRDERSCYGSLELALFLSCIRRLEEVAWEVTMWVLLGI